MTGRGGVLAMRRASFPLYLHITLLSVALVAVNVGQFLSIGWTKLTLVSLIVLPILAGTCALMSRREKCRLAAQQQQCDKE